jgi:hypothetical protein
MIEFRKFGKIPRLHRGMIVTEKIDGTNAAVVVVDEGFGHLTVFAQSRTRIITPAEDNYGFAKWVEAHSEELVHLGVGYHFGEWWGGGIQRKYGLDKDDKRFSLFNPYRYEDQIAGGVLPDNVTAVPIVVEGSFDLNLVQDALEHLQTVGSKAAPGFPDPEGVVVYHEAAKQAFKVTFDHDEIGKLPF